MSNCVTTLTNNGGRARTTADHERRSKAHQPKAPPEPKLLRDDEVHVPAVPGRAGNHGEPRRQADTAQHK